MRKKYIYLLLLSVLTVVAVFESKIGITKKSQPKTFGAPENIGSEEDAKGRLEYDLVRLSDPSTGKIPMYMREKELAFAATLPNDEQINYRMSSTSTVPVF